jgi:hypothetical protein
MPGLNRNRPWRQQAPRSISGLRYPKEGVAETGTRIAVPQPLVKSVPRDFFFNFFKSGATILTEVANLPQEAR